jgi:hypothetical protein
MKKYIFVLLLVFYVFGICTAQEEENVSQEQEIKQENIWIGMVRFNPADIFINLHNALPGLYITWIPYYVLPNLGIPAEIDVHVGWGVLPGVEISLLTGAEYIPIGPAGKDKNGLFLDAKIGLSLFFNEGANAYFIAKSNVGYQLITKRGFVATPAVGVVYNGRSGFGLNLMFDLGFAYKRGKK